MPVLSPPTPAPSPGPTFASLSDPPVPHEFDALQTHQRKEYLLSVLRHCTPSELLFVATTVEPLLKRDFLRDLPPELALHILGFVDDPLTLCRASCVNSHWNRLIADDFLWHSLCLSHAFVPESDPSLPLWDDSDSDAPSTSTTRHRPHRSAGSIPTNSSSTHKHKFSYRAHFKSEFITRTHPSSPLNRS